SRPCRKRLAASPTAVVEVGSRLFVASRHGLMRISSSFAVTVRPKIVGMVSPSVGAFPPPRSKRSSLGKLFPDRPASQADIRDRIDRVAIGGTAIQVRLSEVGEADNSVKTLTL